MKVEKQFVPIPSDLLRSPALMVLNIYERRCLDRIMIEHSKHGGRDNGRLPVTYLNFYQHGVHPRRVAASLQVIEALGLVVCAQKGRSGTREFRRPSFWRLTFLTTAAAEKLANGHTKWIEPSHDWAKIETIEQATTIANQHRPRDERSRAPRRTPKTRKSPKADTKAKRPRPTPTTTEITGPIEVAQIQAFQRKP